MRLVGLRDRFFGERHHAPVWAWAGRLHGRVVWADRRAWPSELPPGWEPQDLFRWFLIRHPKYLELDGPALNPWLSSLSASQFSELEAAAGALLRAWVAHTRAALRVSASDDVAYLHSCIRAVSEITVTGHELGSHAAQRFFPHIKGSVYPRGTAARLMHGISNCDGVNYLLAELLAPDFDTFLARVDRHRLVEVRIAPSCIYLDAQAALPPFVLAGRAPSGALTVDELVDRFHSTPDYDDRVLPVERYRRVWGRTGLSKLPPKPWPRQVRLSRAVAGTGEQTLWDDYMEARMQHLFGSRDAALSGYQRVCQASGADERSELARAVAVVAADHIARGSTDRRRVRLNG